MVVFFSVLPTYTLQGLQGGDSTGIRAEQRYWVTAHWDCTGTVHGYCAGPALAVQCAT